MLRDLALSLLVILLLTRLFQGLTNPLNKLPGPWYARFTNLRLKWAVLSGQRIHYVHALYAKYGPVVRISPNEVAVNDINLVHQIHKVGSEFTKSAWYHIATSTPRPIMFSMPGKKEHAARRRILAPSYSRSSILSGQHDLIRETVRNAVTRIRQAGESGGAVDILKWWTMLSSDLSAMLLYGLSFGNIERGEFTPALHLLTTRLAVTGIAAEIPLIYYLGQILRHIPITLFQELFDGNDVLADYGRSFLSSMQSKEARETILGPMAAAAAEGQGVDELDVQCEATGEFIAGTDTTAITLTYLVWLVLSHPDVRQRLESELDELLDDFGDQELEKLPYLRAVIDESLRLYGAAPGGLPRIVPSPGTVMSGVFLPPGTTVTTQAYSLHYDAKIFPEPKEFRPHRWLDGGIGHEAKRAFLPFGMGARMCLGINLAYTELRLATAEFFRQCKGARLADSVTASSMFPENYFIIAPRGHQCEIVFPKDG